MEFKRKNRVTFSLLFLMPLLFFSFAGVSKTADEVYNQRIQELFQVLQMGDNLRSIKSLEAVIRDFPSKSDVYGTYLEFMDSYYSLSDVTISKEKLATREELLLLAEKGLLLAENKDEYSAGIGPVLTGWGYPEKSVELYEKYLTLEHLQGDLKYYVIDYSDALAKLGKLKDSYNVYLHSFEKLGADEVLAQGFVEYLSQYQSLEKSLSFAKDFMDKFGFSDRVFYQSCLVYEQYDEIEKMKLCLNKLLKYEDVSNIVDGASKEKLRKYQY